MYRLHEAKCSDNEGSFSFALHCSTSRESFRAQVLLFSKWLFWIFSNRSHYGGPKEDHLHLPLMPIGECLLASIVHLPHSKGVCSVFAMIWWNELWKCCWTGSEYVHKFITLLPKDYHLIPSNGAIKLVGPDQSMYTNL